MGRERWVAFGITLFAVLMLILSWFLFQPLEDATKGEETSPERTHERTETTLIETGGPKISG